MSKRRAKKRGRLIKIRNWIAVHAHFRKAGPIKDKKKELAKKICRDKVTRETDK